MKNLTKIFLLIIFGAIIVNSSYSVKNETEQNKNETTLALTQEHSAIGCDFVHDDDNPEVQKRCFEIVNQLFKNSADKTYLFYLAAYYVQGIGVEKDFNKGMKIYEELANSTSDIAVRAQNALGVNFASKYSPLQNLNKAEYWLKKASVNGSSNAQIFYGLLLEEQGKNKESLYWYKKAAKNNNPGAKYKLAKLFTQGHKVGISRKEIYKLLHSAAEQDYPPAFQLLGVMYREDGYKDKANYWGCKLINSDFFKNIQSGMNHTEALNKYILASKKRKHLSEIQNNLNGDVESHQ